MWNHLTNWLKEYFGFSLRETRGFLLLLLLMSLGLAAGSYWPYLPQKHLPGSLANTGSPDYLDSLLQAMQTASSPYPSSSVSRGNTLPLTPFDPDTLDAAGWERVGAPAWLAARIMRYKGDRHDAFHSIADLQRIYNFPEDLLARLEPYLLFPGANQQTKTTETGGGTPPPVTHAAADQQVSTKPTREPLGLNSADTTAFKQIRGIGSKLSARIVSFREKLGGFHSAEQVREVYGLPPEVADALLAQSELDPLPLRKISVNTATAEQLAAHPYLPWKTARVLVAYREQHGPFANAEQLKNVKEADQQTLQKALPYLSFQ